MSEGNVKKPFYKRWWFVAIVVIVLFNFMFGDNDEKSEKASSDDAKTQVEDKKEITEESKAAAIEMDKKIYDIVKQSEDTTKLLQEGADLVANGNGTMLEMYDLAKQAKSNQQAFYSSTIELKDTDNKEYVDACTDYIINAKYIADDMMKYIDKNEMKHMSNAKAGIDRASGYALSVVAKRMTYLSDQGLTDEEVTSILDTKTE